MTIRPPVVAGTFYPGTADDLATTVDRLLHSVDRVDEPVRPTALVVPHAGYRYSGHTAAAAYARLIPWADTITTVVVVGPAHRVALRGIGLSSAREFATPLGNIPVDRNASGRLLAHPVVKVNDATHRLEHSVEVQLPFLQRVLGDGWSLVPVVAGDIAAPDFADAFDQLWGDPECLFLISSDLSHYHPLATARLLDLATAATIVSGDWEHLESDDACGAVPVRGALELARRHGQHARTVELTTSVDGGSASDSVVGYGSFVMS
jgi:AmmeMemoRadiSam system protein B